MSNVRTLLAPDEEPLPTIPDSRWPGAPNPDPSRYRVLDLISEGGMGRVWRLSDRRLRRTIALKTIRPDLIDHASIRERFADEATFTARLAHPGILPILDAGVLDDGTGWYTTPEVPASRTLRTEMRTAIAPKLRERRLVAILERVAQAIAYAHDQGVIHRDLKPENILLGPFGEVMVADWGIAKGTQKPTADRDIESPEHGTRPGLALGTPPYLAPEQATGDVDAQGPHSDVYALGAIVYEVFAGRPLYEGSSALSQLLQGPPPRLEAVAPSTPPALIKLVNSCLVRDPALRCPSATLVAEGLRDWLDGADRLDRAQEALARAAGVRPRSDGCRASAARLRKEALADLARLPSTSPAEHRIAAWRMQDEAARLEVDAARHDAEEEQHVHAALEHVADLPEARARLADLWKQRLIDAEEAGDRVARARAEAMIRSSGSPGHVEWLDTKGAVTLHTEPSGAEVSVFACPEVDRRRVLVPHLLHLRTPLCRLLLPPGSWLLRIQAPDRDVVDYPIWLDRGAHWEIGATQAVRLPPRGELGPDDVYVPGGPARVGGDALSTDSFSTSRPWVEAFVIRRFPVTVREYIVFLDDLVATRRSREALVHQPKNRIGAGDRFRAVLRREMGRFRVGVDTSAFRWQEDWPVTLIDWHGASAYAHWESERTRKPWRLPSEIEWEKSARGVDGRFFPWGDHHDAAWTNSSGSRRPASPVAVGTAVADVSVYGVRDLGGNVRDWCTDAFRPVGAGPGDPPSGLRVTRGGSWLSVPNFCRSAMRFASVPEQRLNGVGFRLARAYPG